MLPMIFKRKKMAEFLRQNSWESEEKKKHQQQQQQNHQRPRTFEDTGPSFPLCGSGPRSFEGGDLNPGSYGARVHGSGGMDGFLSTTYNGGGGCGGVGGGGVDRRRSPSPVGSGEWALRECEAHATWLNDFRKRLGLPQITDLRLAVADGVTLVQLTEALTNSEVAITDHEGPLSRSQALVHLDRCLAHLASRGVDVIGIQASDLVEGDLKSSLLLLGQIRRKYDPTYGRRPQAEGQLSPRLTERAINRLDPTPNMPGRIDTSPQIQRAVPLQKRDKPPAMKRGVAVDDDRMLPGTMGPDDGTPHSHNSTADPARKASTDRAAFGFATHGPDDRRHFHGYSQASSAHPVGHSSKPVPTPRPQSNMASERPPTTLGVAWAANSAPKQRQTNDSVATPQPSSVEERLRNLMMDTQRTTLPVHQYDDGELLLPPPPSRDFGDGVTLGGLAASQADAPRSLGQSADGGFAQSARDHASPEHGYVPSKPSDRRQGPRAETMMQRDTTRSQPDTFARANTSAPSGQYTNYAYVSDSQASSVYSETQRSAHKASDLRSAWNKLYGAVPEWRPVSASAAGVRNGTDRPTAQEEFKRRASQPNTSYHTAPRQSPKGQIPSAPRESPMGQSSSTHQTSGSSSSHQSSYSASGHTTFSTFKPDPGGADQDEAEDEEDKELGSLGTLGPASKYPESAGSRPSSARLTPQTPQGSSFGLREIFQPSSSRPNVLSRTEMRNSPRGPTPVSTRSASRDSLNAGFPPGAAKPSGAISNSSAMNGISSGGGSGGGGGGGLTFRKMSGAMVNPAFTADSVVDDVAGEAGGSTPRSGDGTGMGGSSLGAHSSDRIDPSDSVFDYNRRPMLRGMSESSSNRSVTPPLPPLSPSSSQPGSDPSSPRGGASHHRLNPARPQSAQAFPAPSMFSHQRSRSALSTPKTPDLLVTSATPVPLEESRADGGRGGGNRHYERGQSPGGKHLSVPDRRGNSRTTRGEESRGASRNFARSRSLDDVRESGSESNNLSFDVENTMLMVEPSDLSEMEPSLLNASHNVQPKDARAIRGQLHKLENMYYDVMKLMGAEKTHGKSGRRWSIASSETSSLRRGKHLRGSSSSSRPYGKDIKSIQRRFQRLESHVVTLARTLAHLSSELRAHNTVKRDLEVVKREVRELKKHGATSPDGPTNYVAPFEKFRGWIPSLTNPKRINKLTQFFGQEPPLLEIFLKKLGYERYAKNFANEHIGMIELPYMTEDRLESIGIPMGPRLRILQESQLCFRQENFNIYIV